MSASPATPSPLHFFRERHAAFSASLRETRAAAADTVSALLHTAFVDFDQEVGRQCEGQRSIACCKGCSTCCSLRVTATAPEVLLVARHLREDCAPDSCRRLLLRLLEADGLTRDLDEAERVALRHRCPFIEQGACVIYPVRPLACRGHASHSRRACKEAAAGRAASVPYSEPHLHVRSLVQNAMQSALRDAGLAWGNYELNHGLRIALAGAGSEAAWLAGQDVFVAATVREVDPVEMAAGFDAIKAL